MSLKEKFDKATRVPDNSSKSIVEFLSEPLKTPCQRIAAIIFFVSIPFMFYIFTVCHGRFFRTFCFLLGDGLHYGGLRTFAIIICRVGILAFFCSYLAKFWLFPIINWIQSAKK